jgi:hypothetical protein
LKSCIICEKAFWPRSTLQTVCGIRCSAKVAPKKRKEEAAKTLAQKESLKTLSQLAHEAEYFVNRYVRLRDASKGCVSCDKPASWGGQWHASHFRSVGAASGLRFHLWNIHKACSICNNHKSGNLLEYLPRLKERIGEERVDWLLSQNAVVKRDREYLVRLKKVFAKKCKRIENRMKENA